MKPSACFKASLIDRLIWFILYNLLIIDTLNGICLSINVSFPISLISKTILIFLIILSLVKKINGIGIVLYSFIILTLIVIIHTINGYIKFNETFYHLFKFIICLFIYFYIAVSYSLDNNLESRIKKLIIFSSIIILINIYLGLVGIGTTSYGEGTSKGFLYAGNEVSGLFITLYPIYLFYFAQKYYPPSKRYIALFILILGSSLLLGTKTGLFATLILGLYSAYLCLKNKKQKFNLVFTISTLTVSAIIYGISLLESLNIWQRIVFFYERKGFWGMFFSDRIDYWEEEKGELLSGNISTLLFGLGENRTVEMDIFDTFLNYGIVGLILIYGFYFMLIFKSYQASKYSNLGKLILAIDIFLIIFSSLAGHIIFSGMAAPFIAIVNILPLIILKNREHAINSLKTYL